MARARRVKRSSRGRSRRMRGGWQRLNPMGAPIDDASMKGPTMMANAQGGEYQSIHEGQHGGGLGEGAPVGHTGILDASLRTYARVGGLDHAIMETRGMSDQAGGRRRRRSSSSRRSKRGGSKRSGSKRRHSKRRHSKRRHSKRRHSKRRHTRRSRGGGVIMPASADAPGMILPASAQAEAGMNPEWKLAHNPTSFIPNAVKHSVDGI